MYLFDAVALNVIGPSPIQSNCVYFQQLSGISRVPTLKRTEQADWLRVIV